MIFRSELFVIDEEDGSSRNSVGSKYGYFHDKLLSQFFFVLKILNILGGAIF